VKGASFTKGRIVLCKQQIGKVKKKKKENYDNIKEINKLKNRVDVFVRTLDALL
jgi:hypothetical protein